MDGAGVKNVLSRAGLVLCMASMACQPQSIERLRLTSGETVGELGRRLARSDGRAVTLLLDPEECLQCLSNLSHWVKVRRSGDSAGLVLVLSKVPTAREVTQLQLHRIPIDGVLSDRVNLKGMTGFHALVFDGDSLTLHTSLMRPATSDSLLAAFRRARDPGSH